MWYFAWILGLAMAVLFGILNAMWLEQREALTAEQAKND